MGINPFKRKKKKLEEEEDFEVKPKKKKHLSVEPKKKVPPKPWGRKERLALLILLLTTTSVSGILALSAREYKLPGFPRLVIPSTPDFTKPFSLMGDETIIIEGNNKNVIVSNEIKNSFMQMTNDLSGVYGFYVIHTSDNFSFGVNVDEDFEPASLNKLAVILTAYREYEIGEFDIDDEYVLKQSDKIGGSGSLAYKQNGTVLTYRELINKMGKESDNTAFNVVRKALGDDLIKSVTEEIGMTDTSLMLNTTTVKDIGVYFNGLYKNDLVNEKSSDAILESLTNTAYENWITKGVPTSVKVSHKFGRELHVVNDAGIIFTPNPYILVVMSKGIIEKEADEFFPKFSKLVYEVEIRE